MNYFATSPLPCAAALIPYPTAFGVEIVNVNANLVQNFSRTVSDQLYYNHPSVTVKNVDFCNVTVTYTHEEQGDRIVVETWLPMDNWNGRMQAIGGGGYVAGRFPLTYIGMAGALGQGYVATTTDGGIGSDYMPDAWALNSPGNANLYALQNFGSVSLNDQARIAKHIINSFYGKPPRYSYWSGCSQGGRQGLMLAQRYPNAYDGIAAAAPAIHFAQFIPAAAWAQVSMNIMGVFPPKCEVDALTDAAVKFCDPMDGIIDGLVSDAASCAFDPFTMVGTTVACPSTNSTVKISEGAAIVANLTWTGPRKSNGAFLWHGVYHQSRLTGSNAPLGTTADLGYASTTCNSNGTCVGVPTGLGESWLKYFAKKDPAWNYTSISSVDEYTSLFYSSLQQFNSLIGTTDIELSEFRKAGGKMITYHGLADGLIPAKGTSEYYDRIAAIEPNVRDFFRYFEVPGLAHCAGGSGGQPTTTFQALVDWVEKGIIPETLPIHFNDTNGIPNDRILCPYPTKARLISEDADPTQSTSFQCSI